jgi:tRNA pseudouridine synthase 10
MDSRTPPDPEKLDAIARAAAERAAAALADVEFTTFKCGSAVPRALQGLPRQDQEAFRDAVRPLLQARLEALWPGRRVEALVPEVSVDALPDALGAKVVVTPLLVAGRYRKLERGISQTIFHCRVCRGRGRDCAKCGGTGRLFAESVEEFVRPAIQRAANGRRSAFHGSGREDTDVRMLGTGRPFVVSVEKARRRSVDPAWVAAEVERASRGRVLVSDLSVVTRARARQLTTDHGRKTYRAVVEPAGPADLPSDAPERLRALAGAELAQRTPQRVDGRRADLVRSRRVLGFAVEESGPRRLVASVQTEPGTYVKEMISGDDGRTVPSVAALLGVPCVCAELDVLAVDDATS